MCRWLAYSGPPLYLEELIFKSEYSLIHQSLHARAATTTTNGDGFGVGWYGRRDVPGNYRSIRPAWNDPNLRELAAQIESPLFLAHVRASSGPAIQQSNCHPFRYDRWLFQHNGEICDFARLKRELSFAVAPELYPSILGTTDSELMLFLALTFGLQDDPIGALERMVGFVEDVGRRNGVEHPAQLTLGVADGERLYAVRYSSDARSPTLFHSKGADALRELNPDLGWRTMPTARAIVSEALSDLTEYWQEIPEASVVLVERGEVACRRFEPRPP